MDSTPSDEKSKKFWKQSNWEKSFIPKSLPVIGMVKLRNLIRDQEGSSSKVLIEKLNMENNQWSISKEVIFEIEDKTFAEDSFRMAYKA